MRVCLSSVPITGALMHTDRRATMHRAIMIMVAETGKVIVLYELV